MSTNRASAILASVLAAAATVPAFADGEHADRIAAAFEEKGMPAERADCYGRVLSGELSGKEALSVAEMVSEADGEAGIRSGVKEGGLGRVEAFLSAETECGGG